MILYICVYYTKDIGITMPDNILITLFDFKGDDMICV